MRPYTTVKQSGEAEFIEKRSRFLGYISPLEDAQEAAEFLDRVKSMHRDARHNCYAYILRGNIQRYSDDGEPQGTAGIPILEILKREGIVDAGIVVTRYFGGILLGAPGLVRAYSHTAKLALDSVEKRIVKPCTLVSTRIPYAMYDKVAKIMESLNVVTLDSNFGVDVTLNLRVDNENMAGLEKSVTDITNGEVVLQILGEAFA